MITQDCEAIVSYIEYLQSGEVGCSIVTDYISEAYVLETMMAEHVNPSTVALIYGNIIGAICFLVRSGLIHRGIRPGTILVSRRGSWLTGFSACILARATKKWPRNSDYGAPEVQLRDDYDSRSDVYSLSLVCGRCFSPDFLPGDISTIQEEDPLVVSLLSQGTSDTPDHRDHATEINSHLESLMGNRLEMPFGFFTIVKKRRFVLLNLDGVDWVRAKDLLDAVYSQGPDDRGDLSNYLSYVNSN